MKLMIDANILLDVLQNRKPYVENSAIIWKLCETHKAKGYISTLTFANIVYILRKELNTNDIKDVFTSLSLIFEFVDLSQIDLFQASKLQWNDYEDALQSVMAQRINADYIITRNIADFKKSTIPAFTPKEFIDRL